MAEHSDTSSLPIPWPENAEIKVYSGGCHCKKVRYEFEHPDIYTMEAINCNCSICEDRGYLNVYTLDKMFRFTTGSADDLTTYRFGGDKIIHRFCRVCGTSIGPVVPVRGMVVVNTRTIDGIDLKRLRLRPVNGKAKGSTVE
ncbi:Mss4-like protein [Mycena galericulata]|nr:Mss4-like protein [Mycena galericulata]